MRLRVDWSLQAKPWACSWRTVGGWQPVLCPLPPCCYSHSNILVPGPF